MISKEYLHERFSYVDGELYWKVVYSNRLKVGQLAGDSDGTGYRRIMMGKKHYKMHLLIWIMHNTAIPEGLVVDHIDRNRKNNRIENLRLLTKSLNNVNRDNVKGYSWDSARKKWRAQASVNNVTLTLGRFDTELEAAEAYKAFTDLRFKQAATNDCR